MKTYSKYFEYRNRAGEKQDSRFVGKTDDAPDELADLIRDVHFDHFDGALPNDWIYREILDAFETLEENGNDIENCCFDSDPYYSDLYRWFNNGFADEYCNEVLEGGILGEPKDIWAIIGAAQHFARERIYRAVSEFLEEQENKEDN